MTAPDLSVIITGYDEGPLLNDAIESVASQVEAAGPTGEGCEIVLTLDQGTDPETWRVARAARARWPFIGLWANQGEKGVAGVRNEGVRRSSAPWISFLDGDDVWLPGSLDIRLGAIREYGDTGWIATDMLVGDLGADLDQTEYYSDRLGRTHHLAPVRKAGRPKRFRRPVAEFCDGELCHANTIVIRRSLLTEVGGFDPRFIRAQDTHLWFRLAACADLVFLPRATAFWRQRPSTHTRRGRPPYVWEVYAVQDLLRSGTLERWERVIVQKRLLPYLHAQTSLLRSEKEFLKASSSAVRALHYSLGDVRGWKDLAASLVRRA